MRDFQLAMLKYGLKLIEHSRRGAANYMTRRDILAVGTVMLVIALLVYFTPVQTTFYANYNAFSPSPKQGWYDLGLLYIPAGDTLYARLLSESAMVFGIVAQNMWDAFVAGNASAPEFISSIHGSYGSVSFTPRSGTAFYLVAGASSGNALPSFKTIIVTTSQHSLEDYAILAALPGLILVVLSMTYDRFKSAWFGVVRRHR